MTLPLDAVDDLITRHLAGDLADPTPLNHALADPAARARFIARARLQGHLTDLGRRIADGDLDRARLLSGPLPIVHPASSPIIRHRWRTHALAVAACLLLGLTVLTVSIVAVRTRPLVPTLTAVAGPVTLIRQGHEHPAVAGQVLEAGDRLIAHGRVQVALHGATLTLEPGSDITVAALAGPRRQIDLAQGTLTCLGTGAPTILAAQGRTIHLSTGHVRITAGPALRIEVLAGRATLDGAMDLGPASDLTVVGGV